MSKRKKKLKTRMIIRIYDIKWDTEGGEEKSVKKLPKQVLYDVDLCELEDGLRNGDIDITEMIEQYLDDTYTDYGWVDYEWGFVI